MKTIGLYFIFCCENSLYINTYIISAYLLWGKRKCKFYLDVDGLFYRSYIKSEAVLKIMEYIDLPFPQLAFLLQFMPLWVYFIGSLQFLSCCFITKEKHGWWYMQPMTADLSGILFMTMLQIIVTRFLVALNHVKSSIILVWILVITVMCN